MRSDVLVQSAYIHFSDVMCIQAHRLARLVIRASVVPS